MADSWKIDDKMDISLIFFKQVDRINIIMSERVFDIMQLARAVDALDSNTNFLKNKGKKKKKPKDEKVEESAAAQVLSKRLRKEDMYELARERLSKTMQLLDNNDMLTKRVYEGEY